MLFFLIYSAADKLFLYSILYENIQGGPKKAPYFGFHPKSVSYNFFFHIFQVVKTAGLGDSFDTNMDPTGRFTTQQPIRIIEVYFATKSVLLTQRQCRRHFERNNVPDTRTIQCLVAKFRETGNVADAPQKAAVANIVQIIQIQQARVIFNPFSDIFTNCFSFCFILISLPLQDQNFVRKELKVIMEDPQN